MAEPVVPHAPSPVPRVVLLSGGIDSAATLAAAARTNSVGISAVFVDYGQPARASERRAAEALARLYCAEFRRIRIGFPLHCTGGEYFGRNALFVLAAASESGGGPLVIMTGLHRGSPYYDTTPPFMRTMQRLLDGYSGGTVSFVAPFLKATKQEIVDCARRWAVPLDLTYSCERRSAHPCGQCLSCIDRRTLNVD